jgi:hypothetical protein
MQLPLLRLRHREDVLVRLPMVVLGRVVMQPRQDTLFRTPECRNCAGYRSAELSKASRAAIAGQQQRHVNAEDTGGGLSLLQPEAHTWQPGD